MSRRSTFAQDIISRQERMLRLAERDYGLTLPLLFAETGIPKETLATYKRDTAMPAWALVALCAVIPDDLTSLLFEPIGKHIGTDEGSDSDLDDAADAAGEVVTAVRRARHPQSPGGVAIVHTEKAEIVPLVRKARAKLRRVA